jgi:hypothetical protein
MSRQRCLSRSKCCGVTRQAGLIHTDTIPPQLPPECQPPTSSSPLSTLNTEDGFWPNEPIDVC